MRFPEFNGVYNVACLSNYLFENKNRNKDLSYNKNDVLSVSGEYGIVNQIELQGRSFAGESVKDYHIVETNDIVYTKSPLKANPYGIIKVNKGCPGIVSTLYAVYHVKNNACPKYVDYYFANDLKLNKFLKPLVNIGAKHDMKVNNETVLNGIVVFPSFDEQEKIVTFLSLIDERIEKQRQLVDALKRYKRGVINGIFDNKLYGKSWNTYKLSKILKERNTYCEKNGTYEHVTLSRDGIFPKTERYDRDYLVSSDDKRYKVTKLGDICYNPANMKFGVICLNTYGNAIFSPIYVTFEIVNGFDKNIVAFCLTRQNFINRTLKYQQGTVYERMSVSPSDLLNMEINLPDAESQIKISKQLLLVDSLSRKETDVLYKMELLKRGFLQQLFI